MREISLEISGLGMILYSPPSVAHIAEGTDYLESSFWQPHDVARHVSDCQLTAFCTGTPGSFQLRIRVGPADEAAMEAAEFKVQLGLQVHDSVICIRDLYDLMNWSAECPTEQQLSIANGWYRLTLISSAPPSGILGDGQVIEMAFERVHEKPLVDCDGVPLLCD